MDNKSYNLFIWFVMKELLDHQTFGIYIYLIINLHLFASNMQKEKKNITEKMKGT